MDVVHSTLPIDKTPDGLVCYFDELVGIMHL